MKTTMIKLALASLLTAVAAPVLAAGEGGASEIGWLGIIFLGFGALIIVFQFIPAVMLFGSMLRGLFSSTESTPLTSDGKKQP